MRDGLKNESKRRKFRANPPKHPAKKHGDADMKFRNLK